MMPEFECPECNGDGRCFVHLNTSDPAKHGFQWIDCPRCGGSKLISDVEMAAIIKGRELRNVRVARKMSLREEAKRLGISVVELSRLERGRIGHTEYGDNNGD